MDLGASAIVVAVPPARDAAPGRVFAPCTPARHALVDGLVAGPMATVATAAPGLSWVPLFGRLAPQGRTPALVHARQVTTGPGRQPDGHAAQGLQTRHTLGCWPAAFRPAAELGLWRTRRRQRAGLLAHRAPDRPSSGRSCRASAIP
jgi:hypothetical protein